MTAESIQKLIERYQKISDRNYRNYQQTGDSRYDREYRHAEDILDVATQALASADEHVTLTHIKADFSFVIRDGLALTYNPSVTLDDCMKFLKRLEAYKNVYRI